MSMRTALAELNAAETACREAVSELVMTVVEDRPADSDVAALDLLGEQVLELQGALADARAALDAISEPRELPGRLPAVDAAVAAVSERYWRDLRSYLPMARLRRTARERGGEWRTWQHGFERSLERCEPPVTAATTAVGAAWREVGELLTLCLPPPTPGEARSPAPDAIDPDPTTDAQPQPTRRTP